MAEFATFAAGCFWGIEATFRRLPGVLNTAVGYMGGHTPTPTYQDVCTDTTGHAEVVQVEFDPQQISYRALLEAFWECHDPTQINRQGPDIGTQYRSAIFLHNDAQREQAQASKQTLELQRRFPRPIATALVAADTFFRAEEYHQRYLEKRGMAHCHL
jgi:peptide-methionine (S)-S-oxide reductase